MHAFFYSNRGGQLQRRGVCAEGDGRVEESHRVDAQGPAASRRGGGQAPDRASSSERVPVGPDAGRLPRQHRAGRAPGRPSPVPRRPQARCPQKAPHSRRCGRGDPGRAWELGAAPVTVRPPGPGVLFPAASFVCLHWARSSLGVTVALLVVSSVTSSFCLVGAFINLLDIAPQYVSPPPPAPWLKP